MSWAALKPYSSARPVVKGAAVTISVSKPVKLVQRAYVTVRRSLLDSEQLAWWVNHQPVTVEVGEGEHAGRIRVSDGGPFRIMGATGLRAKEGRPAAPMLQIPGIPEMPADGMSRKPVKWEIVGNALVLILPWSDATGSTKVVPAAPAAVTPAPGTPAASASGKPTQPTVVAPEPAAATTSTKAAPTLSPIAMPYAEIEQWAISNGLGSPTHGFDLAKVNERRAQQGKRPYSIRRSGKGAS